MKVEFFRHSIDEEDISRVNEVLHSIFLTSGDVLLEFEKALATYLGAGSAVGVTSCTAALHLSLLAWGIGEGDEVITTPMTFCATSNSIMHAGAKPVFVDVEKETGNINAELIEDAITPRTRAIIPVHLYGQFCDMRRIREIADRHGLVVIEDAAHCVEGSRDGIRVGELADAACLSFYATKNITSGEGGAIITNNQEKAELLRMLRLHGIDKSAGDRYTKKYRHWEMAVLGWKYNMDNIQAAMLIGQLKRINMLLERREHISRIYEDALGGMEEINLFKTPAGTKHARHLFTIHVAERDSVLRSLQDRSVGVAVNYRAVHLLKYYAERFGFRERDFPIAENIGNTTISIPLYPSLSDSEAEYVINAVKESIRGLSH